MHWRRFGAGIAAAGTLTGAGTAAVDSEINPYEVSAEKYELASISTVEAAGENKVEAHRDRPAVTLSKWNGEAAMTVAYGDINAEGSREFLTDRVEWKGDTEELHAYPLPAAEGMEDGGFEIEVYLRERPASNAFRFTIEGAEELDFFYQPELTAQEIEEGAVRPENVVGSYAVYHKTKANHRVGDTNYATGKAFHIYRPKAIDANGVEEWCELSYENGTLTVTCSEKWLETAAYPVVVDPTFGYTSLGTTNTSVSANQIFTTIFNLAGDADVTSIHAGLYNGSASGENFKGLVHDDNGASSIPGTLLIIGAATANTDTSTAATGASFFSSTASGSLSAGNFAVGIITDTAQGIARDSETGPSLYADIVSESYASPSSFDAADVNLANTRLSTYVTYSVPPPPATAPVVDDTFWFD